MPPLETVGLTDCCVVWAKVSTDRRGDPTLAAPAQYPCRWRDGVSQIPSTPGQGGPDGSTVTVTDARVALRCDVPAGSVVWRGRLEDFDPAGPNRLLEVVGKSAAKDVKGRVTRREYSLALYGGTLPALAT